jgi:hypothetical protein
MPASESARRARICTSVRVSRQAGHTCRMVIYTRARVQRDAATAHHSYSRAPQPRPHTCPHAPAPRAPRPPIHQLTLRAHATLEAACARAAPQVPRGGEAGRSSGGAGGGHTPARCGRLRPGAAAERAWLIAPTSAPRADSDGRSARAGGGDPPGDQRGTGRGMGSTCQRTRRRDSDVGPAGGSARGRGRDRRRPEGARRSSGHAVDSDG